MTMPDPAGTQSDGEAAHPTPRTLACALPIWLGIAVVLGLLFLFFYLLLWW
jgi:hypothetical protein